MHLLVIFTGGTIGSGISGDVIDLDARSKYRLLSSYREAYGDTVTFTVCEPFTLLSENLCRQHTLDLAACIRSYASEPFDGVIVTHGSDTLSFTSAALSYLLPDFPLPVVLVCSNKVLTDPTANGLANFFGAVKFIETKPNGGVYVAYRNPAEADVLIHHGVRVFPFAFFDDTLCSVGGAFAAVSSNGTVRTIGMPLSPDEAAPLPFSPRQDDPRLLCLHAYVDMAVALAGVDLSDVDGMIFTAYHSGTLPTDTPDFAAFCRTLRERHIPAYVVIGNRDRHYASADRFDELGLIPLTGVSPSAMQAKFWLLFGAKRLQDMDKRLCGDKA